MKIIYSLTLAAAIALGGCAGIQRRKAARAREQMVVSEIIQGIQNNESSATIILRIKTLVVEKLKGTLK